MLTREDSKYLEKMTKQSELRDDPDLLRKMRIKKPDLRVKNEEASPIH